MTVSVFDSKIYGGLFSDHELARLFSDAAVIQSMVEVEVALAKVQGQLAIIPAAAAAQIASSAGSFKPDMKEISENTEISGVPTIALVRQLRQAAADAGDYLHWGATSQDIIDTGLVLRLRTGLGVIEGRIDRLCDLFAALADDHRQTVMVGRTRFQQAIPTTFGMKVAVWLDGVLAVRAGLRAITPDVLCVQLGGAVGTLAALSDRGTETVEALAVELDLNAVPMAWHTNRTSFVGLADQLSLITGVLAKFGQDVALLSQSEVAEVTIGAGGGSSTMPHKTNPVLAETLVSLARMNAGLVGIMHQAMVQEHERSGTGWQLELMTLPQMVVACGTALRHAVNLLQGMTADPARMGQNLASSGGLVMAEAAVFILSAHLPPSEARARVKSAVAQSVKTQKTLAEILQRDPSPEIDWADRLDPAKYLGDSDRFIDRVLDKYKAGTSGAENR